MPASPDRAGEAPAASCRGASGPIYEEWNKPERASGGANWSRPACRCLRPSLQLVGALQHYGSNEVKVEVVGSRGGFMLVESGFRSRSAQSDRPWRIPRSWLRSSVPFSRSDGACGGESPRATSACHVGSGRIKYSYAVAGDAAVAVWVTRVDESAVRNTRDVDILIRRDDLAIVTTALEEAGFLYRHTAGLDLFLDGPGAKPRDAVHVVFAGEKSGPKKPCPIPT